MKNFKYWKDVFDRQELQEFNEDKTGLLWLKIKPYLEKN